MGNLLPDHEEEAAVAELSAMSSTAKGWLGHHIRNELQKFMFEKPEYIETAVRHIAADLDKIGC